MNIALRSPFQWFGSKRKIAALIWERFGDVNNYIEPFAGSLAVLLRAPYVPHYATVNDANGFICNFWRAIRAAPDEVAKYVDWPINEIDMVARFLWLKSKRQDLTNRLMVDPDYYDAEIAGWWCWGVCCSIANNTETAGPWRISDDGSCLVKCDDGSGVKRSIFMNRNICIHSKKTHAEIKSWFRAIAHKLRHVRVACGDWSRICTPAFTTNHGLTGVLLDPPYCLSMRDSSLYTVDDAGISQAVREWALSVGSDPMMRIALCGLEGEHDMPDDWSCVSWIGNRGYAGDGNLNRFKERIWFSPHCLGEITQLRFDY